MIDLVALGEILIDFTPSGVNEQGIALFARNPGGAPANVLAMNNRLGGTSAFIGKVGADGFGRYLRQTLTGCGIDDSGLVEDTSIPTTLAFVQLNEQGDRSFSFYRKPGADLMLTASEIRRDLIDRCKIFHFGSVSLTGEPCRSACLEAAAYAKQQGKRISFDPNYRPLLWDSEVEAREQIMRGIALADILKVSEEEMQLITGTDDLEKGSRILLEMGPSLVLVTMGEKGAFYRNRIHAQLIPTYPVKAVDTTGAGDAFVGAMLWCLKDLPVEEISHSDLSRMVDFANAAGSLTTTKGGAIPALPSMEEIRSCRQKKKEDFV
ncbi:MAG: carbohydrate kinase [Faecousia sp.]